MTVMIRRNNMIKILTVLLLCLVLLFPIRRMILGPKPDTRVLRSAPVVFTKS